jgi:hypothetical protein
LNAIVELTEEYLKIFWWITIRKVQNLGHILWENFGFCNEWVITWNINPLNTELNPICQ